MKVGVKCLMVACIMYFTGSMSDIEQLFQRVECKLHWWFLSCKYVDDYIEVFSNGVHTPLIGQNSGSFSLMWPDPILHWGRGSGTWPQSSLSPRNVISHVNPVMTSAMAIGKVRLATFLHSRFRFLLCCSSWLKTLLAQRTSYASSLLSTQAEIWIFPLITYFRYHVTEYCAVIGTHSTVQGDKLLYGHVSDPFPRCGIGSGHTRLWKLGDKAEVIMWLLSVVILELIFFPLQK